MKYPAFIQKNDEVVFVAPSYGCTFEPYLTRIKKSYQVWQELGYRVKYGPNALKGEVIGRSNTAEKCAAEINNSYLNLEDKALISVGGGELMMEILPFIDFELIRNNPKWFMGYSDNTNLTYLIPTICDVASIYGPCAPTFALTPWHKSIKDAFEIITGTKLTVSTYGKWEKSEARTSDNPLENYILTEDTIMKSFPENNCTFSGRLLGGCLDVLGNLVGTKFDKTLEYLEKYKNDGIVWFLEACDLNTMGLRRTLTQLEYAGWFKYTKGFIFGRSYSGMVPCQGLSEEEAIIQVLKKYHVPVIIDVDLGHLPPSMPIITGSYGEIVFKDNKLTIQMHCI